MKKLGLEAPSEEDIHSAFALPTFFEKVALTPAPNLYPHLSPFTLTPTLTPTPTLTHLLREGDPDILTLTLTLGFLL